MAGVPIVISENTPWRDLKTKGIGADLNLAESNQWINYFKKAIEIDQAAYAEMVEDCFVFAKEKIVNAKRKIVRLLYPIMISFKRQLPIIRTPLYLYKPEVPYK